MHAHSPVETFFGSICNWYIGVVFQLYDSHSVDKGLIIYIHTYIQDLKGLDEESTCVQTLPLMHISRRES